jgi:hypothetical protein
MGSRTALLRDEGHLKRAAGWSRDLTPVCPLPCLPLPCRWPAGLPAVVLAGAATRYGRRQPGVLLGSAQGGVRAQEAQSLCRPGGVGRCALLRSHCYPSRSIPEAGGGVKQRPFVLDPSCSPIPLYPRPPSQRQQSLLSLSSSNRTQHEARVWLSGVAADSGLGAVGAAPAVAHGRAEPCLAARKGEQTVFRFRASFPSLPLPPPSIHPSFCPHRTEILVFFLPSCARLRLGRYAMQDPGLQGRGIVTSAFREAVTSSTTNCHSALAPWERGPAEKAGPDGGQEMSAR